MLLLFFVVLLVILMLLLLLLLLLPVSYTTNQAVQAANFDAFPKLMPQIDGHAALQTLTPSPSPSPKQLQSLSQCVSLTYAKHFVQR